MKRYICYPCDKAWGKRYPPPVVMRRQHAECALCGMVRVGGDTSADLVEVEDEFAFWAMLTKRLAFQIETRPGEIVRTPRKKRKGAR